MKNKLRIKSVDELTTPVSFSEVRESISNHIRLGQLISEQMKTHDTVIITVKKPSRYMKKKYGWMEAGKRAAYKHLHSLYGKK